MKILRTGVVFLMVMALMTIKAQEFKIGKVKYNITGPSSVEILEDKKATGELIIPSEVVDTSTGKTYTVTAVGKKAYKDSKITSVTLPSTINKIGDLAFANCKSLSKVEMSGNIPEIPYGAFRSCKSLKTINLENVKTIGENAFSYSGLETVTIPATVGEIGEEAFYSNENLKTMIIEEGEGPIVFTAGALYFTPLENVELNRNVRFKEVKFSNRYNSTNRPFDGNPSLKTMTIGQAANNLPLYLIDGCSNLETLKLNSTNLSEKFLESLYKAAPSKTDIYIDDEKCANLKDALTYINDKREYEEFLTYWVEFLRVAEEEPQNLGSMYSKAEPKLIQKHPQMVKDGLDLLCDNIYFLEKTPSKDMLGALEAFQNNYIGLLGVDYNLSINTDLETWAYRDLLRKDLNSGAHRDIYERELDITEILMKNDATAKNPYNMTMQLVALCGLGEWKKAADYFPKVHRAVTENGKYDVPRELTYMQEVINENGYKAVAPTYPKGQAKAKSSNVNGLVQFFIDRGVEYYERKQAQKRFEKMYKEIEKKYRKEALNKK